MKKSKILIISLIVIALLGSSSGWIYHALASRQTLSISQNEMIALQFSFLKQYGTQVTITQVIVPKIYEIAWTDSNGDNNISMNIGGVWVLIASTP